MARDPPPSPWEGGSDGSLQQPSPATAALVRMSAARGLEVRFEPCCRAATASHQ
ncbi:hypothetical protein LV779_02255 [Streptomyces thinghirensis]|nr:hypothetical protein [Streptomyces thinghirensis]